MHIYFTHNILNLQFLATLTVWFWKKMHIIYFNTI